MFQVSEGRWSPEGPIVAWDVAEDTGIVVLEEASICLSRHSRQMKALPPPTSTLWHTLVSNCLVSIVEIRNEEEEGP